MGLIVSCYRFDGAIPTETEFLKALKAELPRPAIESVHVNGLFFEVYSMIDPVTAPYADAVLERLGGQPVHVKTHLPMSKALPDFVGKPWRSHSMLMRARIRCEYWFGFFSRSRVAY